MGPPNLEVFGDVTPWTDPSWYTTLESPYNDSHRRLRQYARDYGEKNIIPYAEIWEEKGDCPLEASLPSFLLLSAYHVAVSSNMTSEIGWMCRRPSNSPALGWHFNTCPQNIGVGYHCQCLFQMKVGLATFPQKHVRSDLTDEPCVIGSRMGCFSHHSPE